MERRLVYDLPTRIFHWLFALLFATAFFIGKTVDDDSPQFSYHMLAGMSLGFLIILRVFWGFWGTHHARFSGFNLDPQKLVEYFKSILSGEKKVWAGHNPASSWAAIIMMILGLSLGVTGYLMVESQSHKVWGEVHEILANAFILVVILHIAGVIFHTLRHKDKLPFSMFDGKKLGVQEHEQIASPRSGVGILLLALFLGFVINLNRNFDPATQKLNLFGTVLQLGENENDEGEGQKESELSGDDKDHDEGNSKSNDDDGDDD